MAKDLIKLSFSGLEKIEQVRRSIMHAGNEGVEQAVYDIADAVFAQSQMLIPRDRSILAASGRVRKGPGPVAWITYWATHAKPVHFGTRPHYPPREPIVEWARRHGFDDPERAAFFIRQKIGRYGTSGQPFLYQAVERVIPLLGPVLRQRFWATFT